MSKRAISSIKLSVLIWFFVSFASASAEETVLFTDIAANSEGPLSNYQRTRSDNSSIWEQFVQSGTLTAFDLIETPNKWRGSPGVALMDYDNDGDLDIYVTNGPGSANSLFENQLMETGTISFIDVAESAGVAATDLDASAVCFGDIDNDGDRDLFVMSPFAPNRLFENNGNRTFTDITQSSGMTNFDRSSVGCSFGDVNGDGLLDVAVANNIEDWDSLRGVGPLDPWLYNQHNQLFLNLGSNTFGDISQSSGIEELRGFPPDSEGKLGPTWAIALVDYDLDGDADILHADDGGANRGYIHVFQNDGTGHFSDVTVESGLLQPGHWMGLAFGDLNSDGYMDVFGTNIGDWPGTVFSYQDPVYGEIFPYELGQDSSRWFLGGEGGSFTDPGVGELVATPFGWGASMVDYDNDRDTDIIYHGGLAFPPTATHDNPGSILKNDGGASFTYDLAALSATDHRRRTVHGMAVGDLDRNGFADIVSVSSFDTQESIPLVAYNVEWGSDLDGIAAYQQFFVPTGTFGVWAYSGAEDNVDGSLSVEINSGNSNRWIVIKALGTRGITNQGKVNRDGIGAIFRVSSGDHQTMRPVMGGASYASQDSLEVGFGLGSYRRATVDVLWPGGARNKLYNVRHGERILFPEIPCSFDGDWPRAVDYISCVRAALHELRAGGILRPRQAARFFYSAIRAFLDERR